jgi:spore maturation protein CgeB
VLIYPLWLTKYPSGTGEEFFKSSLKTLAEVETIGLDHHGVEIELLEKLEKRRADLIFHVPYRDYFRPEIMAEITAMGHNTLDWQGDDEWLWNTEHYHRPDRMSPCHKWTVTTHEASIPKYQKLGITPILSQWGYSEQEWKPKSFNRDIDVYFCGAKNPERDKYIKRLCNSGVNFSVDGPGYGLHKNKKNNGKQVNVGGRPCNGKVSFSEMVNKYQRAKISVSFLMGSGQKIPYTQVKARCFEIPASGCFQLASYCPDLSRFFEVGTEIDMFKTEDEMEDKIKFYLRRTALREKMAKKAQRRNLEYSYEKIFKRLFKEIGI